MDYRHDLFEWQFNRLKRDGETYRTLSERSGVPQATLCDTVRGKTRPTLETIIKTSEALGLNPKYALDKELKKTRFHLAVL